MGGNVPAPAKNPTPGFVNLDPSLLPIWRARRAGVLAKTNRAKILMVGDSTTVGQGAGTGTAGLVGARQVSYPDFLGARLAAAGLPTTLGSFGGYTNNTLNAAYDGRVTYGSGWGPTNNSVGGPLIYNNTTTNPITFVPAETFDTIDIHFLSFNGNGTFTVNVDGGASAATINSGASNAGYTKQSVSVPRGTHTINIARNGTGGAVYVLFVETYDSTKPAISVINGGKSGSTATDWIDTSQAWSTLPMIGFIAPDLTIIDLGINDAYQGIAIPTFLANIQAIISKAKISGDVALMIPNPNNQPVTVAYANVLRALAVQMKLVASDTPYRFGNIGANGNATASLYYDTLHCSALGYVDKAIPAAQIVML